MEISTTIKDVKDTDYFLIVVKILKRSILQTEFSVSNTILLTIDTILFS